METQTAFWILAALLCIEIFAIYSIGNAINAILKSEAFKNKVKHAEEKKKATSSGAGKAALSIVLLVLAMSPSWAFGMSDFAASFTEFNVSKTVVYSLMFVDVLLLGVILYLNKLVNTMINIDKTEDEIAAATVEKGIDIMHLLTDAVPIDQEESVETDHEYDGIRELDNNLPPWWKYGFYLTIIIGVIYLFNYHILKLSPLQAEAYETEMAQAEKDIQAYLEGQAMNVDENSVEYITEVSALASGEKLFMAYCKVCHGGAGEGVVGPNLTDEYWINGGGIKNIFKTVKYGAKNGMKSWKDELNPIQMQEVSSFIMSLGGTNPANGKAPEGDLYEVADESVAEVETAEGENTEE